MFADLFGRKDTPTPEETHPGPPSNDRLREALEATEALVNTGEVPSPVTARVLRVTTAVRDTLPRLDALGAGSATVYNVMATATDYLPDAVNGYLRLPRRFADTRPVDNGRTSLMVLIDQLDLLGATMDNIFDAVYREDANALIAHGQFLADKFGHSSTTPALNLSENTPTPPPTTGDPDRLQPPPENPR
ncbi:Uncharacterised protein [Dermatophilus congolensis]|uniref:Uncharacterized protein n=1 Tax=Dermatophilus congolensis TaxID=1863 RepID=A0AA46H126_9MICO|nr:hypothetical protein [Dermatophilus congolensis]STD13166.1 Uncharacterised protein [Dermatophilus congolensis]